MEGSGRGPFEDTILALAWRGGWKLPKRKIRVSRGREAGIRTRHHQNTSQTRSRLRQLVGKLDKARQDYVAFKVLTAVVMKSCIFREITPCSPLSVNRHLGGTLKMETTYSSETSVDFQRTTRRYIPEDRILPRQDCFLVYNSKKFEDELSTSQLLFNKYGSRKVCDVWKRHDYIPQRQPPPPPAALGHQQSALLMACYPPLWLAGLACSRAPPSEPLLKTFHIIVSLKRRPPKKILEVLSMDKPKHRRIFGFSFLLLCRL
jgi:hypothetical protein